MPRNLDEIQRLPMPLLAIVVGGFLAIGLGFIILILNIFWALAGAEAIGYVGLGRGWAGLAILCSIIFFMVDLILGMGLLYGYVNAKRGNWNKAMWIAIILGFLLLLLGTYGGKIGGLLGLIGGALIWLDPNLRDLGRAGYAPPPPGGPAPPPQPYAPPPPPPPVGPAPPPSGPTPPSG